jgi:acetylornithine deacetylase
MNKNVLKKDAIHLLEQMVSIQSFSGQESNVAQLIGDFFLQEHIQIERKKNNLWASNKYYDPERPTILLNSHMDTVKPTSGWTRDPFKPAKSKGKLYGLGSNDAGGSLVSLIACFLYFHNKENLPFNLILAATAEEENSGRNGISSILPDLGHIECAIVGEPTNMQMAVAEKGLMVLDCYADGKAAHVAHDDGDNAIAKALTDIKWFHNFKFPAESQLLGPVKMTVTMIRAGVKHNIIPERCKFTVDIRTTDRYSNQDVLSIIRKNVLSRVIPRSTRLNPSSISLDHVLVRAAADIGLKTCTSPTTSDQALIPADSVKIGPGDSRRSHTSDEFIKIRETENGIEIYIQLLERLSGLMRKEGYKIKSSETTKNS